ncbi:MAG TPA: hypothetical protein VF868_06400 [Bacteroidia bacterium]|jgi:hypothetical protein
MKKIGLLVAFLGLVSSAIYAKGGFTGLKNKLVKPVKTQEGKSKSTGTHANRSSVSQSYSYGTSDIEY